MMNCMFSVELWCDSVLFILCCFFLDTIGFMLHEHVIAFGRWVVTVSDLEETFEKIFIFFAAQLKLSNWETT